MADIPDIDPAFRAALSYIDLSRIYYQAHGYEAPYRWATNFDAPFTPLPKPLDQCRVAVVTTSFPVVNAGQPSKAAYAAPVDPPPEAMFTNDLSWHKKATHTDDVECFLPLRALAVLASEGRIGTVNHRYFGVPTSYSQRRTADDADRIADWCHRDEVDLVLLVPL